MANDFQVDGANPLALFNLRLHRGDGMVLVAMNWKKGKPPKDFVGFAIEYKEPDSHQFFAVRNRLAFPDTQGQVNPNTLSTRLSPIQKFRWVHFPWHADRKGEFAYKVTPVFMSAKGELSYGEPQQAALALQRETYPGQLNLAFTRGFVSSQAFVDRYGAAAMPILLPGTADGGLDFVPSFAKADEALAWMGFEARSAILELLDQAIADKKAQVRAVVYDLNEPGIVTRLEKLGPRLQIIIDDQGAHGKPKSSETRAAQRLVKSAGKGNVKRQHMGQLQHNKTVVVDGPAVQAAVCGSTNHSWRGFFVQNNNAIVVRGKSAVKVFRAAFDNYWANDNDVAAFGATVSAGWQKLGIRGIDAQIAFSPRARKNALLQAIADDIADHTESSLFFSLAFLYQTPGPILDAIKKVKKSRQVFSYGISDHMIKGLNGPETAGVDVQKPSGTVSLVAPGALTRNVPQPFKSEPVGGGGTRMHHKFVVIDFDKPTARVYMGSFNFSGSADTSNGENLLLLKDRRIAVSYVVEALRIFDHCEFRLAQAEASKARKKLQLALPPRKAADKAWWEEDFSNARKVVDRELFA